MMIAGATFHCFVALLKWENAFACSQLCSCSNEDVEEALRLVRLAATQHERDGVYALACFFRRCIGCEKDLNLAKQPLVCR